MISCILHSTGSIYRDTHRPHRIGWLGWFRWDRRKDYSSSFNRIDFLYASLVRTFTRVIANAACFLLTKLYNIRLNTSSSFTSFANFIIATTWHESLIMAQKSVTFFYNYMAIGIEYANSRFVNKFIKKNFILCTLKAKRISNGFVKCKTCVVLFAYNFS